MDPLTMAASLAGGYLNSKSDGADKNISMTDIYGKRWAPQMRGWRDAAFELEHPGMYPGNTFAHFDPALDEALKTGINYGDPGGFGYITRQNMLDQGMMGLDAMGGGMDLIGDIQGGTFGQDIWNQTMSNLMPGLPGAFNAATRDDTRRFFEQVMPGINTAAAGGLNTASTRTGVAEGIAKRGYDDRLADVGSALWMNAANQANQNVQDAQGNLLQGFGDFARMGIPGLGDAYKTDIGNLALKREGGEAYTDQQQRRINEAIARHMDPYNTAKTELADQMSLMNMTINPMSGSHIDPGASTMDLILGGMEAGGRAGDVIGDILGTVFGGSGEITNLNDYIYGPGGR